MDSWLLDTDLLKYRLKRKKWTNEEIDYFISNRY
jgi:hypothetical protein